MKPTDSPPPLGLGVIGAGQIAGLVLPLLGDDIAVVALADAHQPAAEALAAAHPGARVLAKPDDLLGDEAVEAVYIATPPATHEALVTAALAAGKHIICEKPWTRRADTALALATVAGQHPSLRVGCCSSRFCFTPTSRSSRDLVAEGTLGRLRRVRIVATGGQPPGPLESMPAWKRDPAAAGGGLAIDWAVYELEWLRFVLGDLYRPRWVAASFDDWRREGTGLESGYHVLIGCDSGLEITLTRQTDIGPRCDQVQLRGEAAGLDVPFMTGEARLHRLADDGRTLHGEPCGEPTTSFGDILAGPVTDLAQAVRLGREPLASASDQVRVHTVLDAIYLAAREQRVVTVPD